MTVESQYEIAVGRIKQQELAAARADLELRGISVASAKGREILREAGRRAFHRVTKECADLEPIS